MTKEEFDAALASGTYKCPTLHCNRQFEPFRSFVSGAMISNERERQEDMKKHNQQEWYPTRPESVQMIKEEKGIKSERLEY